MQDGQSIEPAHDGTVLPAASAANTKNLKWDSLG